MVRGSGSLSICLSKAEWTFGKHGVIVIPFRFALGDSGILQNESLL